MGWVDWVCLSAACRQKMERTSQVNQGPLPWRRIYLWYKDILLISKEMEEILHQLVNIPLFTGFDICLNGAGFLPSTVGELGEDGLPRRWKSSMNWATGRGPFEGHGYAMPQGHPTWQHITSSTLLENWKPTLQCPFHIYRYQYGWYNEKSKLSKGKYWRTPYYVEVLEFFFSGGGVVEKWQLEHWEVTSMGWNSLNCLFRRS